MDAMPPSALVSLGQESWGVAREAWAITRIQHFWRNERYRRLHDEHAFVKYLDPKSGFYYYVKRDDAAYTTWNVPEGGLPLQAPTYGARAMIEAAKADVDSRRSEQRYERQKLIDMIRGKHAEEARKRGYAAQQQVKDDFDRLWASAFEFGRKSGEVNMLNKRSAAIHTSVYDFFKVYGRKLVALRLVNHDMVELPQRVGRTCTALTCLSLSSNRLSQLPESICDLVQLRSLNVLRNQLTSLPERFGDLTRLDDLHLATNRLAAIPITFGNLTRLERVVLDCNRLVRLPETLSKLNCHTMTLNANCLVTLPKCLCNLTALTALSANDNSLKSLPNELGRSRSLQTVHVCANQLQDLPETLAELRGLRALWLDHNLPLSALPWNFFLLTSLVELKTEGCTGMVYPTQAKLMQGAAVVRDWFRRRQKRALFMRKHRIVTTMQDVFEQVAEAAPRVAAPSFFEAGVEHEGDEWYAIVLDDFWSTVLPSLQDRWEEKRGRKGRVTTLPYTREEVERVLSKYEDAESPIFHETVRCRFKRCGCVGPDGARRVCVPPAPGWMCERNASLIKMHVVLTREKVERERLERERLSIQAGIDYARLSALKYARSIDGQEIFQLRAFRQASREIESRRKAKFVAAQAAKYGAVAARAEAVFAKFKDEEKKKRDLHELDLYRVLREELQPNEAELQGYARDKVTAQIDAVLEMLGDMPEDRAVAKAFEEKTADLAAAEQKIKGKPYSAMNAVQRTVLEREWLAQERDLTAELEIDLVNRYCEKEMAKAEAAVRLEHFKMRKIAAAWHGLKAHDVFVAWKRYARREIRRRNRDRWSSKRDELQHAADCAAAVRLARWHLEKFEYSVDQWSDQDQWVHNVTGAVVWSEPTFEEMLPAGMIVPASLRHDVVEQDRVLAEQVEAVRGLQVDEKDLESVQAESDQLSFMEEEASEDDAESDAEEVDDEGALVLVDEMDDSMQELRNGNDSESDDGGLSVESDDPKLLEWDADAANLPSAVRADALMNLEPDAFDPDHAQLALVPEDVRSSKQEIERLAALERAAMRRKMVFHPKKGTAQQRGGVLGLLDAVVLPRSTVEVSREDVEQHVGFDAGREYTQAQMTKMAKEAVKMQKKLGIEETMDHVFEPSLGDKAARAFARFRGKKPPGSAEDAKPGAARK